MIYLSFSLFLIHLWIGFVSCAVYHIVSSPDHHCPVESCLTLSFFVANVSLYLDNNTSLIFQPGNHTIRSKLNVTGVAEFSMISDQSRASITCETNSRAEFIFNGVNHVHVSNLKFCKCYCDIYIEFDNLCDDINLITLTTSSLVLVKCTFEDIVGTDVIIAAHSNITIAQSMFKSNHPVGQFHYFGVNTICVDISNLLIYDTKFIGNKADVILYIKESVVNTVNSTFKYNHSPVMQLINCKADIHNSVFYNNENTALLLEDSIIQIRGSEFKENVGKLDIRGGAINCHNIGVNLINFRETCTFTDNQAQWGGAIYLSRSQCFVAHRATVIIANNRASDDGGGIYLSDQSNLTLHSQSTLQILENRAREKGGGIYASELSSINLGFKSHNINQTSNSTIYFYRNRAKIGGGLYLELNSTVYVSPCLNNIINFDKNSADYGGAVYIFTEAESTSQYNPKCFFQSETFPNSAKNYDNNNDTIECNKQYKLFYFSFNRANYSGFSLYKSAFNKCSIGKRSFKEFKLLSIVSNIQTSDVGSYLVRACYCKYGLPDCLKQISYINIKTGEKLILDIAIVDRGNHIVSGSINSEIRGSASIRDDQKIQDVKTYGCTALAFNIYSFETSQQLIMSPKLKNSSIYISTVGTERSIELNFLACIECPIGFQQIKDDARGCDCVCDVMKLGKINCSYARETIIKKGTTAWMGYLNVKNTSGYLIYPYCPMDYCFPQDTAVEINFNLPNGADAQCALNRSGLLCGVCSPGLSLSLGSSQCLSCHTNWLRVLVAIIGSFLAGIILVASLLMLNLTIATGTLNGLLFYTNIVAANQHKFFPSTSVTSVFVSWLNLELGIDTCFFDRMDFYWKMWIEIAFPVYILLLVVLMIIVSEHSLRFAEIVAKGNPLATLNTLILLSYVKFLRTIILAFSFATLDYPDGSHPVVWWPDATVGYFSGKHIVLWVVAATIFVAGILYTAILFSWQWLLYHQHKRIFKWIIRNQRLCMFVEPNHAPYACKHRYWAGLLLLLRVIVYIISTIDVSSDHTITLLAIGIITFFLTILICKFQPYRIWLAEALELICYANIVCLCFATFYVAKVGGKSQDVIAYISGTLSLVLFLIVLSYHVITQLFFKTRLGIKLKYKLAQRFADTDTEEQVNLVVQNKNNDEPVTYSVVDPPTRGEEERQSHPDIPRSRRNTTNNVSENADCEENELKPMEQKAADSSTPYILMK